jgi:citrate lyase subunit beta/citryl-CoA lyase
MPAAARPRRSMLYMPGSNPRALEKARGLAADALIFDLEDAVAPDAKPGAREVIAAAVAAGGYGERELLLRVNALASPWGHGDLAAAAAMAVDGVLLPKVESADAVRQAEAVLAAAGAPDRLRLWCMMETPLGMLRAAEIAAASPRLGGFVMGTSDLAKDLHARHTRERLPMLTALGLCLLAARAHRLAILDGVHLDLEDAEGFAYSCRQGRELGFDGKTLIHPKQIVAANDAFAPSAEEVAWARKIIAAHAEAVASGKGLLLVDGKLVENLHVEDAHRLVAMADAIAAADRSAG